MRTLNYDDGIIAMNILRILVIALASMTIAGALPANTAYGYLGGIAAPIDVLGKTLLAKHPDATIYHGRVVAAKNDVGFELRILHLLGRDKKTARYEIMYGDPREIEKLDGAAPPEVKKK